MHPRAAGLLDRRGRLLEAAVDEAGNEWKPGARPSSDVRFMVPDDQPARPSAVRAVLENAIRFMRELALKEGGRPRDLHCTRLGCGLDGLSCPGVRRRIEQVEAEMNRAIPHPHLVHPDVAASRRFAAEFTVWGREAQELAA